MITYVSAASVGFDTLASAHNVGYSDYFMPVQTDSRGIADLARLFDVDFGASVVALDKGRPVGLGCLGIRGDHGWISNVAVAPRKRGEGIGRAIMHKLMENARRRQVKRLQLEVHETNKRAIELYSALGYTSRRLLLSTQSGKLPPLLDAPDVLLLRLESALRLHDESHAVESPWQRDQRSLRTNGRIRHAWYLGNELNAYVIGSAWGHHVHLDDLGMLPGAAADLLALLKGLHRRRPSSTFHMANLPEDDPAWPILQSLGYDVEYRQHEMIIDLCP